MENLYKSPASLDLNISVPGFASSLGEKEDGSNGIRRKIDINEVPLEEEWITTAIGGNEEESNTAVVIDTTASGGGSGPPTKKLRLTKEQSLFLEESFQQNYTLNLKMKQELARKLIIKPRQVEVWFQNRRARNKLKQTENEYKYLKRWFKSLNEQNNKLHKEMEELKAMGIGSSTMVSPHGYEPFPSSKLVMCSRCQRVSTVITTDHGNCINSRERSSTC